MATFPSLSTGAILQYPAEQILSCGVQTIRFLDGSDQRYLTQGRMLRTWQVRLKLLADVELAQVELFFIEQAGNYTMFYFPDPFTGTLVPNCRFGTPTLVTQYLGLQDGAVALWVEEING